MVNKEEYKSVHINWL